MEWVALRAATVLTVDNSKILIYPLRHGYVCMWYACEQRREHYGFASHARQPIPRQLRQVVASSVRLTSAASRIMPQVAIRNGLYTFSRSGCASCTCLPIRVRHLLLPVVMASLPMRTTV